MHKTIRVLLMLGVTLSLAAPLRSQAQNEYRAGNSVFVMSNDSNHNAVIAYHRNSDGSLSRSGKFLTGGRGSGGTVDPLGSQGSLTLSEDKSLLFGVNAGSGELSVFRVFGDSLWLLDVEPCGGSEPVAVAQHGNLVYLVNAGGTSNVVGFSLQWGGKLKRIHGGSAVLSTGNSNPGSIAFSPDGRLLLVTEKATNLIDAFRVAGDGTLAPIVSNPSAGPGLFSVLFARNGALLAAETGPAGGSNASAISSYSVSATGAISAISSSVATLGTATCWLAVTPDGRYVYTANAGTGTVSGFAIGNDGTLAALGGTVLGNFPAGATDIDISISSDGKFLYSLNTGSGSIGVFGINRDGTLDNLGEVSGLAAKAGMNGIAAN
jgi:6-phosphogluconolactonase